MRRVDPGCLKIIAPLVGVCVFLLTCSLLGLVELATGKHITGRAHDVVFTVVWLATVVGGTYAAWRFLSRRFG